MKNANQKWHSSSIFPTIEADSGYYNYQYVLIVRHVPSLVLPISDIPYTVNGKKVELAVKKILAGQQVSSQVTVYKRYKMHANLFSH